MVTLGLVGVCKTGAEVHEHIDEGLFKRLGLPEWLIANTVDEYVERAIRLAENHQERLELRRHIIENNGLQTLQAIQAQWVKYYLKNLRNGKRQI